MNNRRFFGLMTLAGILVVLAAAVAIIGFRSEMTRDEVFKSNAACTRAAGDSATQADRVECDRIRREARLTEPLSDTCIIQRRTLKSGWYQRITKCPPMTVPTDTVRASP